MLGAIANSITAPEPEGEPVFDQEVPKLVDLYKEVRPPANMVDASIGSWCHTLNHSSPDGIPELIDDGHDGFLLDINDSENFIRVIKMLNNYDDLRLMGERGRDKINNMFTIDSCVRNHKNVMNKILKH